MSLSSSSSSVVGLRNPLNSFALISPPASCPMDWEVDYTSIRGIGFSVAASEHFGNSSMTMIMMMVVMIPLLTNPYAQIVHARIVVLDPIITIFTTIFPPDCCVQRSLPTTKHYSLAPLFVLPRSFIKIDRFLGTMQHDCSRIGHDLDTTSSTSVYGG